ncbi:MAG: ribosome silencing factor [Armatimonadetes bacterium]|nr:ribosome silencing factor [Armatimonadota bacterium]
MAKRAAGRRGAPASLVRALLAAEAAEGKRAEAVVVLDLREQTLVTDYFVICTGGSRVQIRAIVEGIIEALTDHHLTPVREEDEATQWVLLDYGDVVVHVFDAEARAFYRLERLWADAPVVER